MSSQMSAHRKSEKAPANQPAAPVALRARVSGPDR
jgi:hypothetical protein